VLTVRSQSDSAIAVPGARDPVSSVRPNRGVRRLAKFRRDVSTAAVEASARVRPLVQHPVWLSAIGRTSNSPVGRGSIRLLAFLGRRSSAW